MEIPKTSPESSNEDLVARLLAEYFPDYDPNDLDSVQRAIVWRDRYQQAVAVAIEFGSEELQAMHENNPRDLSRYDNEQLTLITNERRLYGGKSPEELQEISRALRVIMVRLNQDRDNAHKL